jgi:hypothetical protein
MYWLHWYRSADPIYLHAAAAIGLAAEIFCLDSNTIDSYLLRGGQMTYVQKI